MERPFRIELKIEFPTEDVISEEIAVNVASLETMAEGEFTPGQLVPTLMTAPPQVMSGAMTKIAEATGEPGIKAQIVTMLRTAAAKGDETAAGLLGQLLELEPHLGDAPAAEHLDGAGLPTAAELRDMFNAPDADDPRRGRGYTVDGHGTTTPTE